MKKILKSIKFLLILLWCVVALLVLHMISTSCFKATDYFQGIGGDAWIAITLFMLYISFPFGLLVQTVLFFMRDFFELEFYWNSCIALSIQWLAYVILGYLQWFRFVPYCYRKIRDYMKNSQDELEENKKNDQG